GVRSGGGGARPAGVPAQRAGGRGPVLGRQRQTQTRENERPARAAGSGGINRRVRVESSTGESGSRREIEAGAGRVGVGGTHSGGPRDWSGSVVDPVRRRFRSSADGC